MRTSKVALHGGGASKVSNFYEDHWTLFVLIDLVAGLAESITLEPPGTAGIGFEFSVDRSSGKEWHQVKYQHSKAGSWSLPGLRKESVLANFKEKLASDPNCSCLFVSSHAAHPLGKLCDHAAESQTFDLFIEHFLSSRPLLDAFVELYDEDWGIADREAWEWLQRRVRTRTIDAATLEERVVERARTFLMGDPEEAARALLAVARSSLYRPLDRAGLIKRLAASGTGVRDWTAQGVTLNDSVLATSRAFVERATRNFVNSSFMSRAEVATVVERLGRASAPGSLLITGDKGSGKSALLANVVSSLLAAGVQALTVDVTRLTSESSTLEVGKFLGLEQSPAMALAAAAKDRRGVLVVDSLDSLGVNRDKPIELFKAINDLMREAAAHPNVSVVVTCRTEDLEADTRIRSLVREPDPADIIDVGLLLEAETKGALVTAGHDPTQLTAEQVAVARKPACLRVLTRFPHGQIPDFTTEQELFDAFVNWAVRNA